MTSATVISKKVSDGQWHNFKWVRYGRVFQIFLDNIYQTDLIAFGNETSLNLQIGGKVDVFIGDSSGMFSLAISLQMLYL